MVLWRRAGDPPSLWWSYGGQAVAPYHRANRVGLGIPNQPLQLDPRRVEDAAPYHRANRVGLGVPTSRAEDEGPVISHVPFHQVPPALTASNRRVEFHLDRNRPRLQGLPMRIACAQTQAELGEVAVNLDRIERLTGQAADRKAELILFPELMVSGYGPPETLAPLAEPIPGPVADRLAAIARDRGIAVATGFPEYDDATGQRHNTLLLLDASGREQLRYRKVHLWDTEKAWAQAGSKFPVCSLGGLRIGATVCYDVRFPEAARSLALAGAELVLLATAWLGPVDEWELAVRSRALDNGVYVVASAMQGEPYRGSSLIVDPHGAVLARGQPGVEEILIADLDPDAVRRFRDEVPLLRDRQPKSYSR